MNHANILVSDPLMSFIIRVQIFEIADICCHGRVVSVLEGGYGRTPIPTGNSDEPQLLDKSLFAECAIRHLQAMIDPYDLEARFTRI